MSDLAGLVARLQREGIAVVQNDEIPGCYRVFVADPFGNRLELIDRA